MNSKLSEAMDHIHDAYIMDAVNTYRVPEAPAPRGQSWRSLVVAAMVLLVIGVMMIPVFNALDTSGGTNPLQPSTIITSATHTTGSFTTTPTDGSTTAPTDSATTTPTDGTTTTVPTGSSTTSTTTGKPSLSVTLKTDKTVCDANENITFTITGNGASSTLIIYHALQNKEYRYNFTGSSYVLSFYGSGEYQAYVRTTNGSTTLTSATIYFTIKDLCYDGHTFKNGSCIYCVAVDPDYNPSAVTISTDKTHYTTAELVRFTISSADTNNTLCIYGVDSTYSRFIHQAGTFYMVPFPSAGKYKAQVIARTETSEVTSAEVYFTVTDAGDIVAPTYAQVRTNKTTYKPGEAVTFTLSSDGSVNMLQIYYLPTGNAEYYQDVGTTFTYTPSQSGAYHAEVITFNGATSFCSNRISFSVSYPCDEGHTYHNGRCIYCSSSDPNYDPCANGHTFKNGRCFNCNAPDTVSFAIIATDAFKHTQGGAVALHMYCSGTTNNLVIFKPNGITETIQNVGSDYTYTPTIVGQYQAHVVTLNGDSRFESEKITFRVVDPNSAILPSNQQHPCANGHFLEDGTCAKCGSFVYVVYPCSDGHSYENGSCTQCGMVACTTNHTFVQGKHRCTQCNTHVFCLNGVHRVENGVCTLCGKTKPADCTDGHIYCDYVCVRCWSPDPATCRQNSHDFYAENGLDYHYCIRCGVSTSCAYDSSHGYENGICKYCGNFEDRDQDCKLIVNNKDITAGNYVKINIRNSNASIPLTAVLTELGIPWEWESETVLRFGSGDYEQTLDTSNNIQFNWLGPSRTPGIVRKVVDGEVIVDIQSLWTNLLNKMGISCEMDCAAKTIRIG